MDGRKSGPTLTALRILSVGLVAVAALSACLLRGMFFTADMYPLLSFWLPPAGIVCGLGLLFYVYQNQCNPASLPLLKRQRNVAGFNGGLQSARFKEQPEDDSAPDFRLPVPVLVILLFTPPVIAAFYALHLRLEPVSLTGTMNELFRWGFYTAFAWLACLSTATRGGRTALAALWHIVGLLLSLSALLAVCGVVPLPYAVLRTASPEISATGVRLGGLLEYPNTFGAVMAIFGLERWFAVAEAVREDGGRVQEPLGEVHGRKGRTSEGKANVKKSSAAGSGKNSAETEQKGGVTAWLRGRAGRTTGTEPTRPAQAVFGKTGVLGLRGPAVLMRFLAGEAFPQGTARQLLRQLPLFPYAAALLLSESRGAWLAAAAAAAAALPLKRRLAAPLLAAAAAPLAAAALLYRQYAAGGLAVQPGPGLLALAGLWAGALLAGLWLARRPKGAAGLLQQRLYAPLLWAAAGCAVLPLVRGRVGGTPATALARGELYRDAWRLAGRAPWLGRGGETWHGSYLAVQSSPYVGSQVHSGYLDILLNLGIVGLAGVVLWLLAAGWLTAKASPRRFAPFAAVVLHGAVDFDWSYGLIWLLLSLLAALAVAEYAPVTSIAPAIAKSRPSAITRSPRHEEAVFSPLPPQSSFSPAAAKPREFYHLRTSIFPQLGLACILAISLAGLPLARMAYSAAQGDALYRKAMQADEPAVKIALLRQSLAYDPGQPRVVLLLARLLPAAEEQTALKQGLARSTEDPRLNWALARSYMRSGDAADALHWARRSLRLDRYNAGKQMQAAQGMLGIATAQRLAGDPGRARRSAGAGLALLRQFRLLAAGTARTGGHNDRRFEYGPSAAALQLRLTQLAAEPERFRSQAVSGGTADDGAAIP
ncbi:O-antigen ligase family protein [Paenibacillus sp. NFR01]|uniref:O-antigen ligase family protein n=1 Tax=Paenibacillus sp. NFR01 TaxID=1566279 RepID=UPI0008D55D91|nr:O-antigen ligase family protein [Paenibacillus sp. NFR01]SEU25278.1 O-Antigen ligase [Paenibacillus sp. NFR01]